MPILLKLIVLGLLRPKPFGAWERFFDISSTSENRNKLKRAPFPQSSSDPPSSSASMRVTKLLWDDTRCGGQFSMSLNISKMHTCPSVFLLSSFILFKTCLIWTNAASSLGMSLWSLSFLVCFSRSFNNRMTLGNLWTGLIISSAKVCRPHSGLLWQHLRKAWNLGFALSHSNIVFLASSKKLTKGGYAFNSSSA